MAIDLKVTDDKTLLLHSDFGEKACKIVLDKITSTNTDYPGETIEINFEGIKMMDASFADYFILGLQRHLFHYTNKFFVVTHMSLDVKYNIEAAVWHDVGYNSLNLPLLCFDRDGFEVLGYIEPKLHDTFSLLYNYESISALYAAAVLNITHNNACVRLKKIYNLRLLEKKEIIDSHGMTHLYSWPRLHE